MKKQMFLDRKKLIKNISVVTAFLIALTLISSSSLSITINSKSNIEKESSIVVEQSAGLAPFVVENDNIPTVSLPFGAIMWGYIVNSSVFDEGTCNFEVDIPEDINYLQDTESDDFLSGGTGFNDGYWYACENSTGALWKIDPDNGDMTYIGGGGVGLNGLASDVTTNILYGASGSALYMVDPETGEYEFIGSFGSGVDEMIGIACDYEGNMYGWDLGDKLWYIDEQTGEATEIGPLGIDLNYAQDGGFYWDYNTLYLTAFTMSPYYGSYLYTCDQETGECSLIGQLEGNSQITASVISIGWCCYDHDIGVEGIISPADGYAWDEVEVIVKVKNYGDLAEEDVPINVVILKDGVDEEYNETVYVDIDWEETLDVEMPVWTPDDWQSASNEFIDYKIVAIADLYGDENPDNDYMDKWVELYFSYLHDVGCTSVIGPESGPAQTFPVEVTIKNFGQYDECCFKTYVEISELESEYEAYKCTTTIEPGEERELVFDDWTPDFLQYETTGIKNYTVKAWTDMDSPADENPENDFVIKPIQLKFFHDVSIESVSSPSYRERSDRIFYAVDCNAMQMVWFDPDTPGTYNIIGSCPGGNCPQSATIINDVMWFCDTTGMIWKKADPMAPEYEIVGDTGIGELVGLAYYEKTKSLYGCSSQDLYEIDQDTGSATYIGPFQQLGYYMISMDCDRDGIMYGYDLNFEQSRTYTIDLTTGKATPIGFTGVNMWYGQDMAYDWGEETMYACVFNLDTFQGELHWINLETGKFTYLGTLQNGAQTTCLAIPGSCPPPITYIPIGIQSIEVIVGNIGTFPETDMTCYAEIYEYFTNCTNGTLVYEDNITDIDILEPLTGIETLTFNDYDFAVEGVYLLKLNLTDDNDDHPCNNLFTWEIVCDDTPPISSHELDPPVPNGDNGWYVSDLEVTLSAIDPSIVCEIPGSWVKEINYIVNGEQKTIPGDEGTFTINEDGEDIEVVYWAVDWVENIESNHTFYIDMDQTPPDIEVKWESYKESGKWYVKFIVEAMDETSGMAKVEIYLNDGLFKTVIGPGPTYEFVIEWNDAFKNGIFKFVAFDMAGNSAYDTLKGEDITSLPLSKISVHQLIKAWLQRWLYRFPFLQHLLDVMERILCLRSY